MGISDGLSSQEASVAIENMLNMRQTIEVLERMIEEQKLGAERDVPREGTEGAGGGGREEKQLRGSKHRRRCRHLG